MSKRLVYVLIMMVLGALALSGCSPCDMVAPDLVSPDWREILSGDLIWSYSDTCEVDHFEIELAKDRDFSVIEHTEVVSGTSTSWTPTGLDPAYEYFWRVRAEDEGTFGPWSTEKRSFFTGPICALGDLVAPVLTSPAHGGIYDHDYDSLEWTWPLEGTCIPEAYRVEVSRDIDFVDDEFNGGTGTPGTRWGFGSTPPEGTKFYWRITPSVNDFDYGPPSIQSSFWTAPVCMAGQALANPVTPLDNDFSPALATMYWEYTYPGGSACAPEGFHLQISSTSDFSTIVEDITMSVPATGVALVTPLADCHQYYWRVAAISDGVETPFSSYFRFIVDETGMCGCAAGATTIPVQTNPGNYQILPDTDANLRWYNPGGCFPDGAAVQIATDYDFADMTQLTFPGDFVTGYDPPALEPATQYRWKAAYYVEESGSPVIGDFSGPKSFFTGPECTSLAEVVAPVRLSPADGSVITDDYAALKFTPGVPGCIPDGYLLHLHKMADFSDPNLLTEYAIPATSVLTDPLDDCTTYHWSVTAVQDSGYGPESDHGSFYVNKTGACLPPGVPATAKGNFFCKAGSYDIFKDLWTVVDGHRLWAIARNPQTTYLLYTMLDQETKQPFKPEIQCWGWVGKVEAGWPELKDDGQHDFESLRVVNPPDLPEEEEELVCQADLSQEDCEAGGWIFKEICHCR